MSTASQYIASIARHSLYEIALVGISMFAAFTMSIFVAPIREDSLLYNNQVADGETMYSDMSQSGWPLPFLGSYTVETTAKTVPVSTYNVAAGIVDVALFYLIIRLAVFMVRRKRAE